MDGMENGKGGGCYGDTKAPSRRIRGDKDWKTATTLAELKKLVCVTTTDEGKGAAGEAGGLCKFFGVGV